MPEQVEQLTEEERAAAEYAAAEQKEVVEKTVIDWEADDNPYKKRYGDSQGQIQPLVRTINQFAEFDHTTKSWKPKPQQAPVKEVDDGAEQALAGYDPDFVKNVGSYFGKQIAPLKSELADLKRQRQEAEQMAQYSSGIKVSQA